MGKIRPELIFLSVILLVSQQAIAKKSLEAFENKPFEASEPEGLYEVELNIEDSDGDIMKLYADYNADDHTDIVAVTDSRNVIHFYIWEEDDWEFRKRSSMTITFSEAGKIVNLAASDFNHDDKLDLFVVYQDTDEKYNYRIYFQKKSGSEFESFTNHGNLACDTQPVLVDVNGDMLMDILYYKDGRKVMRNDGSDQNGAKWTNVDFSEFSDPECLNSNSPFASPHSISLNDFNGDCKSDLFINSISEDGTDQWFEYWIVKRGVYCLACKVPLPQKYHNHGAVSFADFDDDAIIDMAFPVFGDSPGIAISYNWHDVDRDEDSLCLSRDEFVIGMEETKCSAGSSGAKTSETGGFVFTSLKSGYDFVHTEEYPSMVRVGDFDLDGYPDGVIVLQKNNGSSRACFLDNKSCSRDRCGSGNIGGRRALVVDNNDDVDEIYEYEGVISAAFFDLATLGSVDFLINYTSSGTSRIVGYYNNWYDEVFYLRAQGVNGDSDNSEGYFGMNFKMVATDVDAHEYMKSGIQLSQNGYCALQTPYIMFGVGRTNNYFTKFHAAAPINSSDYDHEWTPIIPKSQLIVYADGRDADDWTLETILNPTEQALIIMMCSLAALIILGIIIIVLHRSEKGENPSHRIFL